MNRGLDVEKSMNDLAAAMQRAQLLDTPAWTVYWELNKALRPYYDDTDEAFFGRVVPKKLEIGR